MATTRKSPKWFTIVENDVGTEAFGGQYVKGLITVLSDVIAGWEKETDIVFRECLRPHAEAARKALDGEP